MHFFLLSFNVVLVQFVCPDLIHIKSYEEEEEEAEEKRKRTVLLFVLLVVFSLEGVVQYNRDYIIRKAKRNATHVCRDVLQED